MTASPVTEDELHAYLDDQLETWRRAEVRALLEASPGVAGRLAAWRRDAEGLRAALAGMETWPPNPTLDPAVIRRSMRRRALRAILRTAAASAVFGLGALSGWWTRGTYVGPPPRPMEDAMDAYRTFAARRFAPVERATGRDSLPSWLANSLGLAHAPVLPDLSSRGFRPLGARLLATSEGAAAMVLYEAEPGHRISFYLRPARHFIPGTRGWSEGGGLRVRYWYRGGYGFAVVGRADDPRTWEIERTFPSL
jgi:anti-sigma factor RsiW